MRASDGVPQKFRAPEGATRLYLATWDFYEWNNNAGERTVKIERAAGDPGEVKQSPTKNTQGHEE